MSYNVRFVGAGPVKRIREGGTQTIGGSTKAELNITYNYAEVYSLFDFSINDLNGKRVGDFIPKMEEIVRKCGTREFKDYWAPTPGNAGFALNILLGWAKQYPDAIGEVS